MCRFLIACAALALFLRVTVFTEGGEAGAYASTAAFWLSITALLVLVIRRDLVGKQQGVGLPVLKWGLMLLALLAFLSWGLFEDGTLEAVSSIVFFICMAALLVLLTGQRIRGGEAGSGTS